MLVRLYDVDVAFSPMIMSDSFSTSQKARDNEFTTWRSGPRSHGDHLDDDDSDQVTQHYDQPLIVQFAANDIDQFVCSAQLVQDYCEGVDLNCGCPQRWALQEGIGACLINKPEFIHNLVRQTRNQTSSNLSISVKIRIHCDITQTVDLVRQIEAAGADFITVHGRRRDQRRDPVNWEAVKTIKDSLKIPVIANGDIRSTTDADKVVQETGVDGVMAARGLLNNPAMFSGYEATPLRCVRDWTRIAMKTGTPFNTFHHHLIYMCEASLSRAEQKYLNTLGSTASVLDYLEAKYASLP